MARNTLDKILEDAPADLAGSSENSGDMKKIVAKSNQELAKSLALVAQNVADLKKEDKVSVSMAPMYRPYFGDVMTVSINGLSVYLPLDGRSYKMPKAYAMVIQGRRRMVDDHITRTARLADIQSNVERSAGELELIPR